MRDVLVVLFWLWVLVALAVYAYRIFRRVTRGPKAEREAAASRAAGTGGGVLGRLTEPSVPPLPEGPVRPRLPQSLQGATPPADAHGDVVIPGGGPAEVTRAVAGPAPAEGAEGAEAPDPSGAADARPRTLAAALEGIRMPADLLPLVAPGEPGLVDGRRARFGATGTSVPTVAEALGEELRRLGYAVDGLDTINSSRAGLAATRDGVALSATVGIDADSGAVVVELNL